MAGPVTRFPILLLALTAVAPDYCVTKCGLHSVSACVGLQAMETRTLKAFEANVPGWTYARTCEALKGWGITVHQRNPLDEAFCPAGGFTLPEAVPLCFGGIAHVFRRTIEVHAPPRKGDATVAHEIAHALQSELGEPIGHCSWESRGITRAIRLASDDASHNPPDQPCIPRDQLESL